MKKEIHNLLQDGQL